MKKKIIMGLFVLTAVIGMGFAATKYACGHVKFTSGSVMLKEKCPTCKQQDADYADRFRKKQAEICTKSDTELTVQDYNDYDCGTYRNSNNNSN